MIKVSVPQHSSSALNFDGKNGQKFSISTDEGRNIFLECDEVLLKVKVTNTWTERDLVDS